MCNSTCSESGQLLTIKPCGWYLKLKSDRDRLAGVVQGMKDQYNRNMAALDKENVVMRRQIERLIDERDALLKVRDAASRWTECDGTEATLPPEESGVILNWKGVVQNAYVERSGEWWDFGEDVDPLKIETGDRWMPWPEDK